WSYFRLADPMERCPLANCSSIKPVLFMEPPMAEVHYRKALSSSLSLHRGPVVHGPRVCFTTFPEDRMEVIRWPESSSTTWEGFLARPRPGVAVPSPEESYFGLILQ